MAEDKVEPREMSWRQLMPWTAIFQGFRVALDPSKLLLAALGIFLMSAGWWALSRVFYYDKPTVNQQYSSSLYKGKDEADREQKAWRAFKEDRVHWNLMHYVAGPIKSQEKVDEGDVAESRAEYDLLMANPLPADIQTPEQVDAQLRDKKINEVQARAFKVRLEHHLYGAGIVKPTGRMRLLPWREDRGPNPYLLVTRQEGGPADGSSWGMTLYKEVRFLLEPLVKFILPIRFFLRQDAGFLMRLFCLLAILWTVIVWGLIGGAITRIAAVQVARQEKIGMTEALRFAGRKFVSYVSAPIFPLLFVALLVVFAIVFGFFHMIPGLGDVVVDGLLWPVPLLLGIGMTVVLIGLVGWPLMAATISTEGTDSWEAVSRSYSYVYQAPWHFLWYSLVALFYGMVVVFFVGLFGSLAVYLSKWGVSQTPFLNAANREPSYLFVYTPESLGWRTTLLQGAYSPDGNPVVTGHEINPNAYESYLESMTWYNTLGAIMVAFWVGLFFLMILGFSYSFFWSASTIIYLLMRRKVDDAEMDEVYLEEESPIPSVSEPTVPPAGLSLGTPTVAPTAVPVAAPGATPAPPAEPQPLAPEATPPASPPLTPEIAAPVAPPPPAVEPPPEPKPPLPGDGSGTPGPQGPVA